MRGKTLARANLAEAVYRKVGLSRTESAELVEAVLEEICEAIVRGETVKLSSFATFHVRDKNERVGRNPKTGEEVPILPRRVMTFKASSVLKGRVLRSHETSMGQAELTRLMALPPGQPQLGPHVAVSARKTRISSIR